MNPALRQEIENECAAACERAKKRLGLTDWKATMILRGESEGAWVLVTSDTEAHIDATIAKAREVKP